MNTPAIAESAAQKRARVLNELKTFAATDSGAWLNRYVRLLDDAIRIPGTDIGIGLDAILGFFFPGIGDALTGIASLALMASAWRSKVPTVVLARMLVNIGTDSLLGSIPIVGDFFDVAFKSNRRNLALIAQFQNNPDRKPTGADYAIVAAAGLFVVASIVIPIVLLGLSIAAGAAISTQVANGCNSSGR